MMFVALGIRIFIIIGANTFATMTWIKVLEYLLVDPGYMGEEMYILRRIENREMQVNSNNPVVNTFTRRHAERRVKVQWGIGGQQNSFRRFLIRCPNRRYHFKVLFEACSRLTNFIHRSRMDFSVEDNGHIAAHDILNGFANSWGQR